MGSGQIPAMERVRECSDSILASADSCCGSPTIAITVQTTRKQVTKHALNSYLPEINKNIQNKTIRSACWIIGPVNKPDLFELKIELFSDNNCHRIGSENLPLRNTAGNKNVNPGILDPLSPTDWEKSPRNLTCDEGPFISLTRHFSQLSGQLHHIERFFQEPVGSEFRYRIPAFICTPVAQNHNLQQRVYLF